MTEGSGYLARLAARRAHDALKRQIVFGMVLGWGLLLTSGVKYFLVIGANDALWQAAAALGALLLAASVLAPALLGPVEKAWMAVGRNVGKVVFAAVLVAVYFAVFFPVGALIRWRRGSSPLFAWEGKPGSELEGWVPKEITATAGSQGAARRPMLFQLAAVLGYFGKNGSYIYLPALAMLLALGLLMFFVQTSSLAPFIYTLF